jgi:hypothetical protein
MVLLSLMLNSSFFDNCLTGASLVKSAYLSRANVAGGLVSADVLFAGLQGQAISGPATSVPRHSHHSARDRAQEVFLAGEKASVGSSIPHRYAEALVSADSNVHAYFPRRLENGDRKQVCSPHCQRLSSGKKISVVK